MQLNHQREPFSRRLSALRWILLAGIGLGLGCISAFAKGDQNTVGAMRLVRDNCLSCHNAEKHKGGLNLLTRKGLLAGGTEGPAVVPSNADKSSLFQALQPDSDPHMPPKKQLSARQIQVVKEWITAGAKWDEAALAEKNRHEPVQLSPLPVGYHPVMAVALSPDGSRLALGRGNRLVVHDLLATNFPVLLDTEAGTDLVRALAWSPDGQRLACGSYRDVEVRSAKDFSVLWRAGTNLLGRVGALAFSPFGGALVVADNPTAEPAWVRFFAADTGHEISAWPAHEDAINALAVSPDGGRLATAGNDKLIRLWEVISHQEIARYEGHVGAVRGVGFNADASELLSVGADKQLKIWDVKSREGIITIGGRRHGLTAGAWSADGKTVAATDDDGRLYTFKEFNRHTGAQSSETAREQQLGKWDDTLEALAIQADGGRIAVGGHDGRVRLLNEKGTVLTTFAPPVASMPDANKTMVAQASPVKDAKAKKSTTAANRPPEIKSSPESAPAHSDRLAVPTFVHDVLPALSKAGCMAGSCHAKPEGQNGFKLSVFNYNPPADYAAIVKDGRGRRIFPAAPRESLLLLKPTLAVDHEGGLRFERDSETYRLLVRWMAGGMPYQATNEPALAGIQVEPATGSYHHGARQALKVTARYADNSTRDVTALAEFVSQDKELATVDDSGQVRIGQLTGESVIVTRFMGLVATAHVTVPSEHVFTSARYRELPIANFIDERAYAHFEKLGLLPSERCSDTEFLRRSALDTIGVLPTPEETRAFLADQTPDKRQRWIEHLLEQPNWADYWANKWADLLRPNPDRVGVKSVYVLDQWLRSAFRQNLPLDQFAAAIITAEGSNHRDGPAVVYRDRREPAELTTMFSQLFLGVRLECAKCHHHPNEKWSQDDFYQFAAFFAPVKQKGDGLSPPISAGTEEFYFAAGAEARNPVTDAIMKPRPPDAAGFSVAEGRDPREALVEWLTKPENPFFAKAAANRVWGSLFGRGLVEPVDDFRASNPAVNEPLLDALAQDFQRHGYDLKQLLRTILSSELYQLSSTPNESNLTDTKNFSRSYRRRLPAEVALDAVCDVTSVPEHFEGCPPGTRAIGTWTFKIGSHFLDAFGRPNSSTDAPCERDLKTSVGQALHLMNSKELQAKLTDAKGRVRQIVEAGRSPAEIVTELYLAAYCRRPTPKELATATAGFKEEKARRQQAAEDVLWALLNSPEFVFNH